MNIDSTVVSGSGVEVVHSYLEKGFENYNLNTINPWRASLPISTPLYTGCADVVHSTPELGTKTMGVDCTNITTFHNYYYDNNYINSIKDWKRRLYYSKIGLKNNIQSVERADVIITVSDYLRELVTSELAIKKPVITIKNGIDCTRFTPKIKTWDKLRILFAGNPIARKGISIVYDLAKEFEGQAEFWITEGLRNSNTKARNNIKVIPRYEYLKMHELYQKVDILLFPSQREGFGLVVAEAMATGIPVICSDNSALPELIEHQLGGFLVPDDYSLWKKHIKQLISSQALRENQGNYNRKKCVEEFDQYRMLNEYEKIFSLSARR